MSVTRFIVKPFDRRWLLERDGGVFHVLFDTREQAVRGAQRRARIAAPAVVLVHRVDGTVEDVWHTEDGDDPT
jgi:hypothetical protein